MVSRGGVAPFDGDLDDYQRYLLDEAKRQRELIKEASSSAVKAAAKAQKAEADAHTVEEKSKAENRRMDSSKHSSKTPAAKPKSFKRELELVEARMNVLNGEGAALEARLAALPLPSEIADIGKRLKVVNDELKSLEDQWLELTAKAEAIVA
jgi:ATP-binding cassette, subfamily F, member 3